MSTNDLKNMAQAGATKVEVLEKYPVKYFFQAIMAGMFITCGVVFSNVAAALFQGSLAGMKIISGITFPIGILLIFFIGGELFTGNVLVESIGVYNKKVKIKQALMVLLISYIGNAVGSFIFSLIYIYGGASKAVLTEYLDQVYMSKIDMPGIELFLRAVLCNFMVCLAIALNFKLKSETAKVLMSFLTIGMFVVVGFEHCIANQGLFVIYYILVDAPIGLMLRSMVIVTLGNIVGGGLLLGLPLHIMSVEK